MSSFEHFQEDGEEKTFTGNTNTNTVKQNALPSEIYTKGIRFYPKSYSGGIALRVELYGYPPGTLNIIKFKYCFGARTQFNLLPWKNYKCKFCHIKVK